MFDSPRNERSFQTFEAPTRSIFAQKSNDARKKRQSMQISHNSIGTRKLHDFPARTNSNTNANYTLSSPKVLDPKRIPGFKINFDSEDAYEGTITKEDSLRSSSQSNTTSKPIFHMTFRRSTRTATGRWNRSTADHRTSNSPSRRSSESSSKNRGGIWQKSNRIREGGVIKAKKAKMMGPYCQFDPNQGRD